MSKILIPLIIKPAGHPFFKQRCLELVSKLSVNNLEHTFEVIIDETPITKFDGLNTPWKRVTEARNLILSKIKIENYDYVLWLDADVIDYPLDMPTKLIKANPDGVSAPWVIIENDNNRFYDCSAFVLKGKSHLRTKSGWSPEFGINILNDPPFYPPEYNTIDPILELDCVGTVVCIKSDIYKNIKHENHPNYTDWFSICEEARKLGRKVVCDRSIIAVHANLGSDKYAGETWH